MVLSACVLLVSGLNCKDTIQKIRNKHSQERNYAAIYIYTVPIPTFMFLWGIYLLLWSVCLFCCRNVGAPNVGINRSLTDIYESGNWDWGCAIPCQGIHKSKFLCIVDSTYFTPHTLLPAFVLWNLQKATATNCLHKQKVKKNWPNWQAHCVWKSGENIYIHATYIGSVSRTGTI